MTKTKHTIVAALIAAAFTSGSYAGSSSVVGPELSLAPKSSLTGALETKVASNYTYRGQVLDTNPLFIPKLDVQASLFNGGSLQFSAEQLVGTKGSTFYRGQYNAGLALSLGRLTVTPGYQVTTFHDTGQKDIQSVTTQVSLNDTGWFPVSLKPTVSFVKDTDPKGGAWYEAKISPGKSFGKVDVSVPVSVGLSSNGYYTVQNKDIRYAYASGGLSTVFHVKDRFALEAGASYYTTDSTLRNSKSGFVTSNAGVSVSF